MKLVGLKYYSKLKPPTTPFLYAILLLAVFFYRLKCNQASGDHRVFKLCIFLHNNGLIWLLENARPTGAWCQYRHYRYAIHCGV